MLSVKICLKKKAVQLLLPLFFVLCGAHSAHAVTINFSAVLASGTCTLNLDKSSLYLGAEVRQNFKPNTLSNTSLFRLFISDCQDTDPTLRPAIQISGEGVMQAGRWLFHSQESTAENVGVMLFQQANAPSYNDAEVKNGDVITIADKGVNPQDQSMTFQAGMTCGDGQNCGRISAGKIKARILFSIYYL